MIDAILYILSTARLEIPYISVQYLDKEIIKENITPLKIWTLISCNFMIEKEQFCDLYFLGTVFY